MKKLLIILVSLVLALSVVGVVSGADATGTVTTKEITSSSGTTTISYGATEQYIITIPHEIKFSKSEETLSTVVKAESVTLNAGKQLNLTVSSKHGWKLYAHTGEAPNEQIVPETFVKYTMKFTPNAEVASADAASQSTDGITDSTPISVLTVNNGHGISDESTTIYFTLAHVETSGTYKDTLTFYVSTSGDAVPLTQN